MEELTKATQTADLLESDLRELWSRLEREATARGVTIGDKAAFIVVKDTLDKVREIQSTLMRLG